MPQQKICDELPGHKIVYPALPRDFDLLDDPLELVETLFADRLSPLGQQLQNLQQRLLVQKGRHVAAFDRSLRVLFDAPQSETHVVLGLYCQVKRAAERAKRNEDPDRAQR